MESVDHEGGKVNDSLVVDIVGERDVGVVGRVVGYGGGKHILTSLDQSCVVVQVILGINVHINNVVAQIIEEVEAARCCRAVEVRGSEVYWEPSEQVAERHLVVDNLGMLDGTVDQREVLVCPTMTRNLMARTVHSLHDCRP
jgi:hypothetical protein